MRTNLLRQIWQDGKVAVNGWLSIPSGFSAEVMAQQGYDALTVDIQHGMHDFQTALQCFQAISTTSVVPLVRVPWLEPSIVMKCLDAGAYGPDQLRHGCEGSRRGTEARRRNDGL